MPIGSACLAARPEGRAGDQPVLRPVAASTRLRAVLDRPAAGRVLAVFPTAVYVEVGTDSGLDVVALVASDGLRLPLAAVLAESPGAEPFAVHRAGDEVAVHDGGLRIGPVRYVPGRWWSPRTALAGAPDPQAVSELAGSLMGTAPAHDAAVERVLAQACTELRAALTSDDAPRAGAAADAVLGLGPGLTPSGDDLLAGLLVTCHGLARLPLAAALGRHVTVRAGGRTTALSAALLRCAAAGAAASPVVDLVDAVAGRRPLAPALRTLLAVGHTSGYDTARGVHLAARILLDRTVGAPLLGGAPPEEDS